MKGLTGLFGSKKGTVVMVTMVCATAAFLIGKITADQWMVIMTGASAGHSIGQGIADRK